MELKQKGADAMVGSFKQMQISLIWSSGVDLDLMAFYKTKDGKVGGVWSPNYTGGSKGTVERFPYIELSGDQGVGAAAGKNREEIRVAKLDDLESLYICALNFTDASSGAKKTFADYDAHVEVVTDTGDTHTVALDSNESGHAAVLCKFTGTFMGTSIVNNSDVMDFKTFQTSIPGADALKLSSKIVLKQKGASTSLIANDFQATLRWKASVDLDLYCFYRLKDGIELPKKSLLGKILKKNISNEGEVSFMDRGSKKAWPWIWLDKDAGVGDRGGDNEENIYFTDLEKIEYAMIAANIFNKPNANFASYDGTVIVRCGQQEIEVPLVEKVPGAWCVIAMIDNSKLKKQLINVNRTSVKRPAIEECIEET